MRISCFLVLITFVISSSQGVHDANNDAPQPMYQDYVYNGESVDNVETETKQTVKINYRKHYRQRQDFEDRYKNDKIEHIPEMMGSSDAIQKSRGSRKEANNQMEHLPEDIWDPSLLGFNRSWPS